MNFIYLGIFLTFVLFFIFSYINFLKFIKKNCFIEKIFPPKNNEYDIYELFEIQAFFYALFVQYNLKYKKNQSLPLAEDSLLLEGFNKGEIIFFLEKNYSFIKSNFIIFVSSVLLFLISLTYLFFD